MYGVYIYMPFVNCVLHTEAHESEPFLPPPHLERKRGRTISIQDTRTHEGEAQHRSVSAAAYQKGGDLRLCPRAHASREEGGQLLRHASEFVVGQHEDTGLCRDCRFVGAGTEQGACNTALLRQLFDIHSVSGSRFRAFECS